MAARAPSELDEAIERLESLAAQYPADSLARSALELLEKLRDERGG